jgi:hypothetical protein
MNNVKLFYKCGVIADYFESEREKRIRAEYSERKEKEILRNMLTDTETAVAYIKRVHEIGCAVKAEIESALGFAVDVGFDPDAKTKGVSERVDSLETTTDELAEALTMILEGVTE